MVGQRAVHQHLQTVQGMGHRSRAQVLSMQRTMVYDTIDARQARAAHVRRDELIDPQPFLSRL